MARKLNPKHGGGPKRRIFWEGKEKQILDGFRKGKGIAHVCSNILHCTPQMLGILCKEHEELFSVIEEGKLLGQAYFEELGLKAMAGRKRGFNVTLWNLFMMNRYGWSQKNKVESEIKSETTVRLDDNVVNSMIDKILETE